MIARTTATRVAPASTTSSIVVASIPPIANQGTAAWCAAYRTSSRPTAGRPGFVEGGEHGADADVVRLCGVDLTRRVRREAGAQPQPANGVDGKIILTDVHEVGSRQEGEIRSIVHHQGDAQLGSHVPRELERREQVAVGDGALPDLNCIDATGDRRAQEVGQIGPHAGDEIQAHRFEHRSNLAAGHGTRHYEHVAVLDGGARVVAAGNRLLFRSTSAYRVSSPSRASRR